MLSRGSWTPRRLGAGYLITIGAVFTIVLITRAVTLTVSPTTIVPLATGVVLSAGLLYAGMWLYQSTLTDQQVWQVAQWGALGVAIPTTGAVVGILFLPVSIADHADILITLLAAGGVVGSLMATVDGLSNEHERAIQLYTRNQILHRLLRHNVRNGLNIVSGHADLLEGDLTGTQANLAKTIREHADHVAELSETARSIRIDDPPDRTTIDVVPIVDHVVRTIEEYYPTAQITTELPPEGWVKAGDFLELVVWHLVENAIEHNSVAIPTVEVSVTHEQNETVAIHIADNGPGLPDHVVSALEQDSNSDLETLGGIGLWTAQWYVENAGGELRFTPNESPGTTVTVVLDQVSSAEELVTNVTGHSR